MERPSRDTGLSRLSRFFTSTELAVLLFLAIALLAIPGTFTETKRIYFSPLFTSLVGMVGVVTLACTVRRIRTLHLSVLVIHGGVILSLAGALVSTFGFVATVNVYEGSSVREAFRWDMQADAPLGMELTVKRINTEYYPVPVKVGVLLGREKHDLFTLNTGESFPLGEYTVAAGNLDPVAKKLVLTVSRQGRVIGSADTAGMRELPAGFPYDFRLVAFKSPVLKRMWVDLLIARDARKVAEGSAEVNRPFQWEGVDYFHVQSDRDPAGRAYAGLQIVRDPGKPLVFSGFALVGIGALLTFARRFYGNH
jgi:hypothetical protein